jgi:hypothetical protein
MAFENGFFSSRSNIEVCFVDLISLLQYPLKLTLTASVVWWLACWPLVPEFAGSIPAEAVGFF